MEEEPLLQERTRHDQYCPLHLTPFFLTCTFHFVYGNQSRGNSERCPSSRRARILAVRRTMRYNLSRRTQVSNTMQQQKQEELRESPDPRCDTVFGAGSATVGAASGHSRPSVAEETRVVRARQEVCSPRRRRPLDIVARARGPARVSCRVRTLLTSATLRRRAAEQYGTTPQGCPSAEADAIFDKQRGERARTRSERKEARTTAISSRGREATDNESEPRYRSGQAR